MNLFDVKDKVAIVTRGNRGIGFALARGLGDAGARVIIANRDIHSGEEAARRLREQAMDVSFVRCDVSRQESISQMVDETELAPAVPQCVRQVPQASASCASARTGTV
jgi:2-deoxy-D-gluconate 3-dehydrogenase